MRLSVTLNTHGGTESPSNAPLGSKPRPVSMAVLTSEKLMSGQDYLGEGEEEEEMLHFTFSEK